MLIRPYTDEDLQAVRSLHERFGRFPMPTLSDGNYIVKEVAESNGKIVGLGTIRKTAEVITILDHNEDLRTRAVTVNELLRTGIHKSQMLGVDELHAFLTGSDADLFAKYLSKRFGFVECHGKSMTLIY